MQVPVVPDGVGREPRTHQFFRRRGGALLRDESRGSHYKPEFPNRDDEKFMKHTIATYAGGAEGTPKLSYRPVDISLMQPVLRDYTKVPDYAPASAKI